MGCSGGLCEETQELPCTEHSRFQSAPLDPPQSMADPLRHEGDALEKACLRKDKVPEQLCGFSAVRWC